MSSSTGPIGAAAPPPGETPNFDNPRDAGHRTHMIITILFQIIIIVAFLPRLYVKLYAAGKFQLHYGLGHHIWEITASNFSNLQKWLYISSLLYSPAAFFTKVALMLLTTRVFSVDRVVTKSLQALLFFFLIAYIPAQVAKAVVCLPVEAFWDPTVSHFTCINQTKLFIYDTAISIVSDAIILIVPVVLTWRLRVSMARKIKIVGLLGAGGVAVSITAYRMYLVIRYENTADSTADFVPLDWTV
ncbi:hypothetical protein CCHL11_02818 [Colletotrichum chlorophyti]|uniref:Rhodopsin domain-containing protein n=1 Tax=Colletotrichum chlorophyti TaxID=708187 RepID=A0A1Q8S135_9PEZI|nr:hypothetical protein CCHL11_02818 [Colletotrichum chlorophyti]